MRNMLFDKLKKDLIAHANAEEQTLYAELIADSDTQEQARHSVHEHEGIDELLETLEETDMSSPAWMQTFKKLRHEVEHHMAEEEEDVFEAAKDVIAKKDT